MTNKDMRHGFWHGRIGCSTWGCVSSWWARKGETGSDVLPSYRQVHINHGNMGHRLVGAVTSSTKLFVIAGRLFRLVGSFDQRPLTPAVASLSYYGTTNEAADLVQDGHSMNKLSMVVLRRCLLILFFLWIFCRVGDGQCRPRRANEMGCRVAG